MIDWIRTHREHVGFVVLEGDEPLVTLHPNDRFALASTFKVLVLIAYAEGVAAGRLDAREQVPVAAIERWYWPNTDGGAHDQAKAEWVGERVSLDAVARAMIRWSDNAATDYLLERIGVPTIMKSARYAGMRAQEPPCSIFGEFVAWRTTPREEWLTATPERRSELSLELAASTTVAEAQRSGSFGSIRDLAAQSTAGTPLEWARLMRRIHTGTDLPAEAVSIIRRHLEWPMESDRAKERFTHFGTKGGSLPGIITEASFLEAKNGKPIATAIFFRNLPPDDEADFRKSYAHQQLIVEVAVNAKLRERLARELA